MFRHKNQNVIIPQYEHTKMVGILSQHWGNDDFLLPSIPLNDFYLACYTHDLGFGDVLNDTYEIGNMNREQRSEVIKKCVNRSFSSNIEAIIVKRHFLRLLEIPGDKFPDITNTLSNEVEDLIHASGISPLEFDMADTIIDLLDAISFDFSTGEPSDDSVELIKNLSSDDREDISYKIIGGEITLSSWPFDCNEIIGAIIGFKSETYPNNPHPVLLPFKVTK